MRDKHSDGTNVDEDIFVAKTVFYEEMSEVIIFVTAFSTLIINFLFCFINRGEERGGENSGSCLAKYSILEAVAYDCFRFLKLANKQKRNRPKTKRRNISQNVQGAFYCRPYAVKNYKRYFRANFVVRKYFYQLSEMDPFLLTNSSSTLQQPNCCEKGWEVESSRNVRPRNLFRNQVLFFRPMNSLAFEACTAVFASQWV